MRTRARLDAIENAVRAYVSEEKATAFAMASPEQGGDRRGGLPRDGGGSAETLSKCPAAEPRVPDRHQTNCSTSFAARYGREAVDGLL
jgi:hypothetical protein